MTGNLTQIIIEPVTNIPETASVCHFDEIEDSLQETIVSAQNPDQSTITVDSPQATEITECGCDIIKFTEYYSISRL